MTSTKETSFHYAAETDANLLPASRSDTVSPGYEFSNFFHPFVGDLINKLNQTSVAGMLDPNFLDGLRQTYTLADYPDIDPAAAMDVKQIDLSVSGPYANYNWELLYHIPVMVAVHLSNNQRFAEAQKWFHYVFDPTCTDAVDPPRRFWKFLAFRKAKNVTNINTLLELLSTPDDQLDDTQKQAKNDLIVGYNRILRDPFNPHAVARSRQSAYQWYVVMKYLDNLIAWGDSLFLQDTVETINEATLCYVLAANILGPRPQQTPPRGTISPKNFRQLKEAGLDVTGNAIVELEGQFPFNLASGPGPGGQNDQSGALFGIGRALYFCIPPNQNLLAYWDKVADRLFKIRNSENIQGIVQQLPLFDPPLDPGMLVKAAAAGIDIGSVVSGLNQPLGPSRAPFLIQKALEVAAEVRSLGNALLSSIEKGEGEKLTLLRQSHEVELQQKVQGVRFLQWHHAQETTNGLLKTRATALERYRSYLRLLGIAVDANAVPATFELDRQELREDNFDAAYNALVLKYDLTVPLQSYSQLQMAGDSSPSNQSGASGPGQLHLIANEDAELNQHLPTARDTRTAASIADTIGTVLTFIPEINLNLHFWGLGASSKLFGGSKLSDAAKIAAEILRTTSGYEQDQAGIASRTASYQRRVDDWTLQANLAARELMQIGRQIIASLIAEQIANHEYQNVKTQICQAKEVQASLENKYTNIGFYQWQTSEVTRLYYQYYRFAFDTARKAEQTMKRELMRPELDATSFIQFNYWDSGHNGLLSGEALYLDLKRMEMAYHDSNKRELELTRHVSLRQLDPLALLQLKINGSCTVAIPEWLYDLDCPGVYMRRIKNVALSIPCVVGPYNSLNCTLSLQQSALRVSPQLKDGKYGTPDPATDDDRFLYQYGVADIIVTSGASNDSGMFETNLKDDRFLPFEGAGAVSSWMLSLAPLRAFDYLTISDVILHIRYTARQAGEPLRTQATEELKARFKGDVTQGLVFCLRYDFPSEWSAFVNGTKDFAVTLQRNQFPYLAQTASKISIDDNLTLYATDGSQEGVLTATALSGDINSGTVTLTLPADSMLMRDASRQVFLLLPYQVSF
jgi:Tc toxin complex TcA C-terminal TcB-binding domain